MTLLIKGARPYGEDAVDVLVEDGVITEVGSIRSAKGADVLDADGLVALPGLVDLHTHLRDPGREDAETIATGAAAAAVGVQDVGTLRRADRRRRPDRPARPGRPAHPPA